MRSLKLAMAALVLAWSAAPLRAQDPAAPPPELKVLEDTIGTWEEVLTNKPTEWKPKSERVVSVTKKNWSLGGRFIRMEGIWNPGKDEFISLLTYDPATMEFRTWYFESGGGFPRGDTHAPGTKKPEP